MYCLDITPLSAPVRLQRLTLFHLAVVWLNEPTQKRMWFTFNYPLCTHSTCRIFVSPFVLHLCNTHNVVHGEISNLEHGKSLLPCTFVTITVWCMERLMTRHTRTIELPSRMFCTWNIQNKTEGNPLWTNLFSFSVKCSFFVSVFLRSGL
jgi:hypothetical protein